MEGAKCRGDSMTSLTEVVGSFACELLLVLNYRALLTELTPCHYLLLLLHADDWIDLHEAAAMRAAERLFPGKRCKFFSNKRFKGGEGKGKVRKSRFVVYLLVSL